MKKLFFLFTLLLFLVIFTPAVNNYFFQDDFYHLEISSPQTLMQVADFFRPQPGFSYRPFAKQGFYFILQSLFSFKASAYHWVLLLWFMLNIYLVYKFYSRFFTSDFIALIGSFFYALSAIHYMSLFWIAAFYYTQSLTFFLLSFHFFLDYYQKNRPIFLFISLLFLIFALFTNEITILIPVILAAYFLLFTTKENRKKRVWVGLVPFFLFSFAAAFLRFRLAGAPAASDYSLSFNLSFISNLRWYFLRLLGLPEGLRFISGKNPIIISCLVFFLSYLLFLLANLKKVKHNFLIKYLLFSFLLMFLGALPFYFMPGHMSSYYLEISILGFVLVLVLPLRFTVSFTKTAFKPLLYLALLSYFTTNLLSVRSMQQTHWVSRRGKLAEKLAQSIRNSCLKSAASNTVALYLPAHEHAEASIVLHGSSPARIFCGQDYRVLYLSGDKKK